MSLGTHTPFLTVLARLAGRRGYTIATLPTLDATMLPNYLTAAYRYALGFGTWNRALIAEEVTLGDDKEVARALLQNGLIVSFTNKDPLSFVSPAARYAWRSNKGNYYVDTTETTAWALYRRGPAELADWPEHEDWGGDSGPYLRGKVYAFGDHYYRCIIATSTAGPSVNFAWLQAVDGIETFLETAVVERALGEWLGSKQGEKGQQAQCYAEAERLLNNELYLDTVSGSQTK